MPLLPQFNLLLLSIVHLFPVIFITFHSNPASFHTPCDCNHNLSHIQRNDVEEDLEFIVVEINSQIENEIAVADLIFGSISAGAYLISGQKILLKWLHLYVVCAGVEYVFLINNHQCG